MAKEAVKTSAPKADVATRGKKGDGPVVISFLDNAGNESKRVNEKTEAIRVADKNGGVVNFSLTELSPAIRNQLAILGIVKRVDTFVRNGAKQDGANVINLANSVIGSLKEGTIYSRKEGGASTGRPFDFNFYRLVMEATAKAKGKPASEKQLEAWENGLKARTPTDRKTYIAKLKTDPAFMVAFKKAEAQKLAQQVKSGSKTAETDALADLF